MQVPVHVRDQIKSFELLGYSANHKRAPLGQMSKHAKPQHTAEGAEKATASAA